MCKAKEFQVLLAMLIISMVTLPGISAESQITDSRISDAVEDELWLDKAVPSHRIDIDTIEGIVTLTGSVDNILAKERATRIARIVRGVRSVVNNIKVTPPVLRRDSVIRRDVKTALKTDPATDLYEIDVDVDNNVVTLSGTVQSWQERQLSETVAKGVKGVKEVTNRIIVAWPEERSDFEIKKDIEKALEWDAYVNEALIDVDVKKGMVTLSGTVGSAAEKSQALVKAYVTGVKKVNSSLLEVNPVVADKMLKDTEYVSRSEDKIEKAVADALLYDPRVSSFLVTPDAEAATVILRGTVDNLKAKHAAAQDARNTVGVHRVVNRIKVRPADQPDDKGIKKRIKKTLRQDPYLGSYDIIVKSVSGVVDLYGAVDTFFEKAHADDVVSRVNGVLLVDNNLTVLDTVAPYIYDPYVDLWYIDDYYGNRHRSLVPAKADWEIKNAIEHQFFWSPFVDGDRVTVSVNDGEARLTGVVDSWGEYFAASDNAYQGGAVYVDNELTVK